MGAIIPYSHKGFGILGHGGAGILVADALIKATVLAAVAVGSIAVAVVNGMMALLAVVHILAVGSQLDLQLLDGGVSPSLHKCVSSFLE